jgi:hypothetical protein
MDSSELSLIVVSADEAKMEESLESFSKKVFTQIQLSFYYSKTRYMKI